jgi:hypothetical protein
VKDRLIWREEHGFVQGMIVLQGLYSVTEERGHKVRAILRNFEIEKKESDAVILAQSLDELGEREERDALPRVLIAVVLQQLVERYFMERLGQQWMAQTTHPSGTQRTFDAWHPVVPQHHMLITGHTHVEFQGIGPMLEGCLEALQGIFARLVRGTPMPNNQEIGPWGLLSHGKSSLSTRQDDYGPESECDAYAHMFPGASRPHSHLSLITSQGCVS